MIKVKDLGHKFDGKAYRSSDWVLHFFFQWIKVGVYFIGIHSIIYN